jgi:hypothetical protein
VLLERGASRVYAVDVGRAFALAENAEVEAYEQDEAAIAALAQAARATPRLKPVRTFARDLFRAPLTARELARYDAIVLDSPRAGAKAQAETLAASSVPKVIRSRAIQGLAPATCASCSTAATTSPAWSRSTRSCSRLTSSWWLCWSGNRPNQHPSWPGLVPAIHVFDAWQEIRGCPGLRPGMTRCLLS